MGTLYSPNPMPSLMPWHIYQIEYLTYSSRVLCERPAASEAREQGGAAGE